MPDCTVERAIVEIDFKNPDNSMLYTKGKLDASEIKQGMTFDVDGKMPLADPDVIEVVRKSLEKCNMKIVSK